MALTLCLPLCEFAGAFICLSMMHAYFCYTCGSCLREVDKFACNIIWKENCVCVPSPYLARSTDYRAYSWDAWPLAARWIAYVRLSWTELNRVDQCLNKFAGSWLGWVCICPTPRPHQGGSRLVAIPFHSPNNWANGLLTVLCWALECAS